MCPRQFVDLVPRAPPYLSTTGDQPEAASSLGSWHPANMSSPRPSDLRHQSCRALPEVHCAVRTAFRRTPRHKEGASGTHPTRLLCAVILWGGLPVAKGFVEFRELRPDFSRVGFRNVLQESADERWPKRSLDRSILCVAFPFLEVLPAKS